MQSKLIEILLVEDNDGDVRLTEEAFNDSKLNNNISVVNDGIACLQFLRKENEFFDAVRPDLILLDLNLPKKDGREVLAEIKGDSDLKKILVIVLTTSDADTDILKAYENYANCYIKKPVDFEKFIDVVQKIENFWFTIVKLP